MSLVVEGLVVEAPNGARLLDGVGFVVPSGTMLAVAGPTGAGKTTLAHAITGAVPVADGSISVGECEVGELDASRRGIGYVAQEDALHQELSVRRTLEYAAALRMPGSNPSERRQRIEVVLDETRLTGQAGQAVRSLSVGQRKRVCIAIELLSMPSVLVLDEPTSSLDPGYEASVLSTLRRLADLGHAVVVVTHSQTAIAGCDRVVLLTSTGRLAYFGEPSRMHERFGTTTAGELFSVLDGTAAHIAIDHPSMLRRAQPITVATEAPAARRVARRQLSILARRYFDLTFADRRRSWLLAAQGVVLGILLLAFVEPSGLARPINNPDNTAPLSATGMAVLLAMCLTWLGMSNSVREIVKERHILLREHRAGLSPAAYVGSKLSVLGPLLAAEATVVTVFAVGRQHVPGTGAALPSGLLEVIIAMSLAGISAVSLGLLVSAIVRSADKALAVLPMIVVVEFVLSGLTPSVSWMPGLAQVRDLASTHWTVQAIDATVTGDGQSWLIAVGALFALTVASLGATLFAVRRSLRLPVAQLERRSLSRRLRDNVRSFNPEMVRLARVGVACLAGVALVVTGARIVVPFGSTGGQPALAATAEQPISLASFGNELPGVLGDFWWMWQTGTKVGIAATEAAYIRSKLS